MYILHEIFHLLYTGNEIKFWKTMVQDTVYKIQDTVAWM